MVEAFRAIWPDEHHVLCSISIFISHIYWYLCRSILLINLFYRRFKPSRLREMLE